MKFHDHYAIRMIEIIKLIKFGMSSNIIIIIIQTASYLKIVFVSSYLKIVFVFWKILGKEKVFQIFFFFYVPLFNKNSK